MTKFILIAISLVSFYMQALAAQELAADVVVTENVYARPTIPNIPMGAMYLTLTNTGKLSHSLVAASSSVADSLELHGHEMSGGMMRMRQADKIELAAEQTVILQPGGLHVMLIGVTQPLIENSSFEVKLVFEDTSEKVVEVAIKPYSH